jgi:protein tyrosine/serine phosphatase
VIDRALTWDGCLNVRDLGGHATEDGAETRFGAIVRADSVRQLSDDGWRNLVEYGIETIVDLRFHTELDADPPRDVEARVVHVPVFPEPGDGEWREIDELAQAAPTDAEATRTVYHELLERRRPYFAEALTAVADAAAGGVIVHCTAGKDRTGLVSALLLRNAGVPVRAIGDDYALSERYLADATRAWVEASANDAERRWRVRLSRTPAAAMTGVIDEVERFHGSVAAYLRGGGTTDDALARARARLRP